jgi:hypothetical protein
VSVLSGVSSALVASALGAASPFFYVIGLLPVLLGLSAGVGASTVCLTLGTDLGRRTLMGLVVGILVGWCTFQWWEDRHFQAVWAQDLAKAREIATGLPADAGFGEDDVAFFAPESEAELGEQIRAVTGRDDRLGRWLFRADAGVRLVGPWDSSRGLKVGRAGAVAWAIFELLLATLVGRAVLTRVTRARSAREAEHLDGDAHDQQGGA